MGQILYMSRQRPTARTMTWPCGWSTLTLLLAVGTGCSAGSETNPGSETGGTPGSGGASATGGTHGTGGTSSSGGTVDLASPQPTPPLQRPWELAASPRRVEPRPRAVPWAPAAGLARAGPRPAEVRRGRANRQQRHRRPDGVGRRRCLGWQRRQRGRRDHERRLWKGAHPEKQRVEHDLHPEHADDLRQEPAIHHSVARRLQEHQRLPADHRSPWGHRQGRRRRGVERSEGPYFGLWDLSKGTTIFVAPSADGGLWDATNDTAFVTEIIKAVEADLCIDTSRIMLEGFSQGAAMSWTLGCKLTGVFRAIVGHSGGGVANPSQCQPIAYFGSGGKQENVTQTTQSDQFARWDGCTIETFAPAPSGGHMCNDYKGCSAGHPVRWCPYDGPHTPSPTDSGKTMSWMPSEVWPFFSQF